MEKKKESLLVINIISVAIPIVVAVMLGIRTKLEFGDWTKELPFLNAIINSLTAIFLLIGLYFIKRGKVVLHKLFLSLAFSFGGLFLVFYVLYHISNPSTPFGGEGIVRYIYYFVLISHILASLLVLPFVLRAYYFGWFRMDSKHRKIVKIAFPIWLYVSVSGVIAYLMISPYYNF